ncbi:ChaN family lipoprotein [Ferrimonas sp. SCSIO 43195]|uniref:ChaN family lipoprotein n=1 Tax=Ferrimonas sp. SCSIO 43195 TaxID=2822844 RepID=UPI0020759C9D|nr:ChaN family lipoprotein [Ferrimonas sp. SCSIO 43195]USD39609.1 ChaN family lipoprotein [Ferrimonas sp. SCSIO 43195]
MIKWMMCATAAAALVPLLSGCGNGTDADFFAPENPAPSANRLLTQQGQPLTPQQLLQKMRHSDVIYLGETHDNPHHHQMQLQALTQLLDAGIRPALGFEFFFQQQTGWLMDFSLGQEESALVGHNDGGEESALRRRLGWTHKAQWQYYAPLLRLARQYQLPVFGADLDVGLRLRLSRTDVDQLTTLERRLLPKSDLDSEAYRQLMLEQLDQAHCHHADHDSLQRLYTTWLVRNEAMADAIVAMRADLTEAQPVVMILGKGHTEFNMGVVERVAQRQPELRQLNIGLAEGQTPGQLDFSPEAGPRRGGVQFDPAHSLYWVTEGRYHDALYDPCDVFRNHSVAVDEDDAGQG